MVNVNKGSAIVKDTFVQAYKVLRFLDFLSKRLDILLRMVYNVHVGKERNQRADRGFESGLAT